MSEQLWAAIVAERARAERVASSRCATREDAEDCVQEAMARVAAMPGVDVARIGPLLATVTANLAADTHRRSARVARVEPRLRAWAPPQPTPEEVVCDAAEAHWLWLRRKALRDQDRAVLELRAQDRSVAETADALGLTYKAAEASFTRARAKMRAIWRATAAALGILWGRPTRESRAIGPASLAAAAGAMAFVLLPGSLGDRPPAPSPRFPAATPGVASDAPADREVVVVPASARSSAPPQRTGRHQPVAASRPTRTEIARRQSTHVGAVTVGGTAITREREEEDLAQTVQRCLREGLIVSITEVDCAG